MEKIEANMILEVLGRPKEHIIEALDQLVKKLSEEKGVVVKEKKIHEAVEVKDSKDLFTSFAEINLVFDDLLIYFAIMFGYMPANIEMVSPERIILKNDEFNMISNRLMLRLHDYDAIVKKSLYDRDNILQQLKIHAPHLFQQAEKPVFVEKVNENNQNPDSKENQKEKTTKKPKGPRKSSKLKIIKDNSE